ASRRTFRQHGRSGLWVSDWYPEIAGCVDDMTVIRSCVADGQTHVASVCQMNTGSLLAGRPAVRAWALYGLGAVREHLAGSVGLPDRCAAPSVGRVNWGARCVPPLNRGPRCAPGKRPVLSPPPTAEVSDPRQRGKLDYINPPNHHFAAPHRDEDE